MKAVVCLPTYNERENLERMVGALADKGVSVLVIDDNSPDGTGRLADELAARNGHVEVLHRERKEGLGPAYLAGFRRVLEDPEAALVLEMDADFSHDPNDVPRLIAAARGADLVLGSRYVEGGSVGSWGVIRRFISAGGSFYARVLLGVGVRDLTGGFKCFRAGALRATRFETATAQGYAFQVELTWRVLSLGLQVVEVPIRFRERRLGESKMSARIAREAAWKVPALRFGSDRWRPSVQAGAQPADPLLHEG